MGAFKLSLLCKDNRKPLMINQVRNFAHTMNNPITRKAFFLRNFAPKRYSEFRTLMYTLNTQFHLGTINEAEMDSALLAF
jgi:hypothetical protein